ncbi:MAG: ATP-binding protein [Chlamydiia bacterium]|nr:ATP-binding protein [Chlamydiia bacterium]
MFKRWIQDLICEAMTDTPVVFINGPRQAGKSTLMQQLASSESQHVNFDDLNVLQFAREDPVNFLANYEDCPLHIDEVQRVPSLFPTIKLLVDKNRRPGHFLLTGSANVLLLPQVAESLAGRMETLTLYPLSMGERYHRRETFIEDLFSDDYVKRFQPLSHVDIDVDDIHKNIISGGFPEIHKRPAHHRQQAWFRSYIENLLKKDVQELAHIENLTKMPNLLALLATRSGSLLNQAELSRSSALPTTTLKRYFSLLETFFLVHNLPAWAKNRSKRYTRSPKVYMTDTGVLCHLLKIRTEDLTPQLVEYGRIVETFVINELLKIASWNKPYTELYHYRTATGLEVDCVLSTDDRRIAGIEVKASRSVQPKDFKGLYALQQDCKDQFWCGIVLYMGTQITSFGPNMLALPISCLWN